MNTPDQPMEGKATAILSGTLVFHDADGNQVGTMEFKSNPMPLEEAIALQQEAQDGKLG